LIRQLVGSTRDVERQNRARMLGIELLIETSRAYAAFENCLASERTLEKACQLAHDTPMLPTVANLLDKTRQAAQRQRKGVPFGQRTREGNTTFTVKEGGKVRGESWLSAIPYSLVWWAVIVAAIIGRTACSLQGR
jgi:hypothetical protein